MSTVPKKNVGYRFPKGHKHGVGNGGASRPNFLTQALISQLNEMDHDTGIVKLHEMAERLINLAMGGEYIVERLKRVIRQVPDEMADGGSREEISYVAEDGIFEVKSNKKSSQVRVGDRIRRQVVGGIYRTRFLPPDLGAIREVFDRVQGRAVQSVGFDTGTGRVTIVFDPEDSDA